MGVDRALAGMSEECVLRGVYTIYVNNNNNNNNNNGHLARLTETNRGIKHVLIGVDKERVNTCGQRWVY